MAPNPLSTGKLAAAPPSSPVVPLASARDAAQCGNKACHLARVAHLGCPVPAGIVITNAVLDAFLRDGCLHQPIEELCGGLANGEGTAAGIAADAIRARILAHPVPQCLRAEIDSGVRTLGPGPFMVRSSAHGEDACGASFAGQLDSIADVGPGGALLDAVVRVWASRWSHRALAYGMAKGAALQGMGVIVQRQVAARWSGVLFTEAPADRAQMLLEFCSGMGEALVSGRANPGRIRIARRDLRWSLEARPDTGPDSPEPWVDGLGVDQIARAGIAIERGSGCPQDIEWAVDRHTHLWIVQARPITARSTTSPGPPGSGRNRPAAARCGGSAGAAARATAMPVAGDTSTVCWSNANVSENFPQPVSPLLYSIASAGYYHYFRNLGLSFGLSRRRIDAMEQPLRHIIGVHGGRMYYNLTSIHAVLRSAPFGDLLAASFDQFVGSQPTGAAAAVPFARRKARLFAQAVELTRIALRTCRQYSSLERRVSQFERRVDAFAARTRPDRLGSRSLQALLGDFRKFLHIRCRQWNDAALADAGSMVSHGVLQRLLRRAFPDDDQQELHNSLLKALPGLVSGMPALELWRLAQLVRRSPELTSIFVTSGPDAVLQSLNGEPRFAEAAGALARFQEAWGFRCSGELMLTVPSFQENPALLVTLIRNYLQADAESPERVLRRQATDRVETTRRVRHELRGRRLFPFVPPVLQRLLVMRVLRWTQTCICLRERARLKQALLYSRLRRVACEVGQRLSADGRLDTADDIFYLTADEIDALLSGSAMFPDVRGLVSLRRQSHAALARLTPPDTLTLPVGEYFTEAGSPVTPSAVGLTGMTGLGACGGRVTAPAAVLSDLAGSHRLRPGDVLVTRQTDPGWGPIFPLISGLVVERGGLLSHGAIIAREFGIPSVVGVPDATRRIHHGSVVTVDGSSGTVEIAGGSHPESAAVEECR
jgi:pyruvate,water dikinase